MNTSCRSRRDNAMSGASLAAMEAGSRSRCSVEWRRRRRRRGVAAAPTSKEERKRRGAREGKRRGWHICWLRRRPGSKEQRAGQVGRRDWWGVIRD
ncbi:hypothetical protein BDA96_09G087300 [Sorghum bicolor]|uniref:Uncharacterized protein n=1 Tax=Sorghum bicolor TaxID=4558 RepID=A0A921Q9F9_SORBI|nr:hypothetical protein BDA96_09G087300 [Sorghum bicolor]